MKKLVRFAFAALLPLSMLVGCAAQTTNDDVPNTTDVGHVSQALQQLGQRCGGRSGTCAAPLFCGSNGRCQAVTSCPRPDQIIVNGVCVLGPVPIPATQGCNVRISGVTYFEPRLSAQDCGDVARSVTVPSICAAQPQRPVNPSNAFAELVNQRVVDSSLCISTYPAISADGAQLIAALVAVRDASQSLPGFTVFVDTSGNYSGAPAPVPTVTSPPAPAPTVTSPPPAPEPTPTPTPAPCRGCQEN